MRQALSRYLILAAVALAACDDRSPLPTAPDATIVAQQNGALRDAGIQTDDSWLTAVVTTTTDGASSTADIEAGYGSSGELRFGIYWTPTVPSVSLAGIRYVGNRVEMINAAGAVISSNSFNGLATSIGLPGGSLAGAILATDDPGEGPCNPAEPGCLATLRDEATAQAASARSPDERRIRRRVLPARTKVALSGEGDYADVERVYRRQRQSKGARDLWRLEEIHEARRQTTDNGPRVSRTTTKIRYTRYRMQSARESARAAAFRAAPPPPVSSHAAAAVPPLALAVAPDNLQNAAVPFAGTDADGILDPFCVQGTRNDHWRKKIRGGYSIIYQHGFCSDAAAFDGFRPRIAGTITLARERAYSLNSTVGIEQQVTDLNDLIASAEPTRNIVIGHSQGGLVARRFGQRYPQYVSSVITIGTPQGGSLLAALGPEAINELVNHITHETCATAFLCSLVEGIVQNQLNGRLSVALLDNGAPSLQDLQPGSPFLTALNSTHETFARASVETDVGNRWAIARMVGDSRSPVTGLLNDQRPAGDAWVTAAEYTYRSAQALQALSFFTLFYREARGNGVNCAESGYLLYWEACTNPGLTTGDGMGWIQTILAINTLILTSVIIEAMNAVDGAWDYATTRRQDGTDGLIHLSSQRYPEAPGAFTPERFRVDKPGADSHAGQLASPSTLQRTLDAVRSLATKNP